LRSKQTRKRTLKAERRFFFLILNLMVPKATAELEWVNESRRFATEFFTAGHRLPVFSGNVLQDIKKKYHTGASGYFGKQYDMTPSNKHCS
jgi:hypothetical protein